jgi:MFS family permease
MAVVTPEERSAASGVTSVARSIGASVSPMLAALLVGNPAWASLPFFLSGGIKIVYDLMLYRSFVTHKPPEEAAK